MTSSTEEAAQRLITAATTGIPCAPVRDLIGSTDIDAAYAVQELITTSRTESGVRVVGRKIGLTSDAVRKQLGVFQPDVGTLFADMSYASGEPVLLSRLMQPRIEAEVAFILRRDLDNPHTSVTDVLRATDFVLAAVEIVDSRISDWDIRLTDTVTDNASGGLFVLGMVPYSLMALDLTAATMTIQHEGVEVSGGSGAACMGSPVHAVAWLAAELAARGNPLRAGEVVLSGALGPVVPISRPSRFQARVAGIGVVEVEFEGALR
jgi:2-keto-4-pentenoate hydratase